MRGIIYCIKEKEKGYDSPIYIGSTKDFNVRNRLHKSNCYNNKRPEYNVKLYQYIRSNGGWDTFEMLEIGALEYETTEELRIEEQKWIDDLGATLNSERAYLSPEEQKERTKRYNKKHYKGYDTKYYQKNIEQKKKYREENKEQYKGYNKKYREKHKEQLNKNFDCPCGSSYTYNHKARHLKTKKHKTYAENLNKDIN